MQKKIKFILAFFIAYFLFLFLGVYVFGGFFMLVEEQIIFGLLKNNVNYKAFEFVVYCTGIVSVAAYLGCVVALLLVNQRVRALPVVASVIVLFLANLLRIMLVMLSEKVGIHRELHVISWFLMFFVVVLLIYLTFQKQ